MNFSRTSLKNELNDEDIDFIMANTDFERDQVLNWYNDFREKCPENRLDKKAFIEFYKNLIPGNSYEEEQFCEYVFQAFDSDQNGYIDFGEFLISFWIRAKGSVKEKLSWLFDIYDTDRSNYITLWELSRMLRLLFKLKNINEDPYDKARKIFNQIDRSKDGKLTRTEFIAGCTRDEELKNLFAPF